MVSDLVVVDETRRVGASFDHAENPGKRPRHEQQEAQQQQQPPPAKFDVAGFRLAETAPPRWRYQNR